MENRTPEIKEWNYDENDANSMRELENFKKMLRQYQYNSEVQMEEATDPLRLRLQKINNTSKLNIYNRDGLVRQLDISKKELSALELEYNFKTKEMLDSYTEIKSAFLVRIDLLEKKISHALL